MRPLHLLSALIISAPGILCAESAEQAIYQKLVTGLHEEVRVLSSMVDEASAKKELPALQKIIAELKALNEQADEQKLWSYIENTPEVKQPLLDEVELLFLELQRIEKQKCFRVKPLEALLRPMLIPAS